MIKFCVIVFLLIVCVIAALFAVVYLREKDGEFKALLSGGLSAVCLLGAWDLIGQLLMAVKGL